MTADPTPEIPDAITEWAEVLAERLAADLVDGAPTYVLAAQVRAATADRVSAYQALVTLSRTVALVLRPTGHAGGPIGSTRAAGLRAAQLVGFAAQGDVGMVDAIARAILAAPDPLGEAQHALWAILEVLATEPVTPEPKDQP